MVREATPEDALALTDLERATCEVGLAHIFDPPYPTEAVLARWRRVLAVPTTTTLLTGEAARPSGYAAYGGGRLRHFGVSPDRYGSGLADALLEVTVARMLAEPARPLRLWVLADNARARAFYERNAWQPDGRSRPSEFPPYPTELAYVLPTHSGPPGHRNTKV